MIRATIRATIGLVLLLTLAACGADHTFDDAARVAQARYVSDEPPSITLYTVINNNTGAGGHASLLINGSERVIYDPAGTWYHPSVPVRNDLHYGMTPRMVSFYIDYHARVTYRVIEQKLPVTREMADRIIAAAMAQGSSGKAMCANNLSAMLRGIPGFESIGQTWFPKELAKDFGKLQGVTERVIRDGDPDENSGILTVQANGEPGGI